MVKTIAIVNKFSLGNPGPFIFEGQTLTPEDFFEQVKPAIYLGNKLQAIDIGGKGHVVRDLKTALEMRNAGPATRGFLLDAKFPLLKGGLNQDNGRWSAEAVLATHIFKTVMELADVVCWFRNPKFGKALGDAVAVLLETAEFNAIFGDNIPDDQELVGLVKTNLHQTQALLDSLLAPEPDLEQSIKRLHDAVNPIAAFQDNDTVTNFVKKLRQDLMDDQTNKKFPTDSEDLKDLKDLNIVPARDEGGEEARPNRGLIAHYRFFRYHSDKLHRMIRFPLVSTAFCYYYFTKFCENGDLTAEERQTGAGYCQKLGVVQQKNASVGVSRTRLKKEEEARNKAAETQREDEREDWKQYPDLYQILELIGKESSKYWDTQSLPNRVIGREAIFEKNLRRYSTMALRVTPQLSTVVEEHKKFTRNYAYILSNSHREITDAWNKDPTYNATTATKAFLYSLSKADVDKGIRKWFEDEEEALQKCNKEQFGLTVEGIIGREAAARLGGELKKIRENLDKTRADYDSLYIFRSGSSLATSADVAEGRPAPIIMPGLAAVGLEQAQQGAQAMAAGTGKFPMVLELNNHLPANLVGTTLKITGPGFESTAEVARNTENKPQSLLIEAIAEDDPICEAHVEINGKRTPLKDIYKGEESELKKAQEDWAALRRRELSVLTPDKDTVQQIGEIDGKIVEKAAACETMAMELRALTVIEYLLAAPKAQTEFDHIDFSQQLGLMEEVVSNLAIWDINGLNATWLQNSFDPAERTNPSGPLGTVNVGLYVNAPSDDTGIDEIATAAKHWKTILNKFSTINAYIEELNRVTDFIDKAKNSGIRVIIINQSWEEYYNPRARMRPSLFIGEHQSRICYLGTQAGQAKTIGAHPAAAFNPARVKGSWANNKPDKEYARELQCPLFLSAGNVKIAMPLPRPYWVEDQNPAVPWANSLTYGASLLHRERSGWETGIVEDNFFDRDVSVFAPKDPPDQHDDVFDYFCKAQLEDKGVFAALFYQGLLNLVLLARSNPANAAGLSVADALKTCSNEDIAAAFKGFDGMPIELNQIFSISIAGGGGLASLLSDDQFPGPGALWNAAGAPNGVSSKAYTAPEWLTTFGKL